ncbi:AlpA family transcriptional regulator [Methylocaldum sp. 14B]|jgi:prophage regulatory protein|uniref:AlpA family phage regulatory protein n=1 Tax=Methylocaldum sp. 14B TaxID=1912213 RepID=UPI00098BC2E9|nr:AlpA family transcriptional regulator [Methylocaldum sp. 14B]
MAQKYSESLGRLTIIKRREVETRTTLSRSTVYAKLDPKSPYYDPTFPKPVPLGGRAVGWVESEIDGWIAAQIARRDAA